MRKGAISLNQVAGLTLLLVTIALIVGIGAWIQGEMRENIYYNASIHVENESIGNITVNEQSGFEHSFANTLMINGTQVVFCTGKDTLLTEHAHYEVVNGTTINITERDSTCASVGNLTSVNYSWRNEQPRVAEAEGVFNSSLDASVNLSTWLPIIAIVVAAVIVIGLITAGFGTRSGY